MAKEEMRPLRLDPHEWGLVVNALAQHRENQEQKGHAISDLDDLLLKVMAAEEKGKEQKNEAR